MCACVIPASERDNYKNAFDAFDEDRDDKITSDVLGKLLRALGYNPYPEEVEDMIEDVGGDGKIDFDSFMYLVSKHAREANPEQELIDAFKVFDKDGSGKLPKDKLRKILQNLKQPFTNEQIDELFQKAGNEQLIDYTKFVEIMLNF